MTQWWLVAFGVLLTVGTAIFVAAEFSLVALDRHRVQQAIEEGDARAGHVLKSLTQLSTQLSAAQVGITLTTLLLGYVANPSVGALLAGPLATAGVPEGSVAAVASISALLLTTVFSMVVGELAPKTLGISAPLRVAKAVALPVQWFSLLMRPLIAGLNGSANAVLSSWGITPQEELSGARTPQELASLVRRSAQIGTLDEEVARRVVRTLDFGERIAADVMTPRVRCTSIERTATAASLVALARRTGHSRFPVTGDDWDDIDGVVHVKRAIAVPHDRRKDVPVSALMDPPTFVPEAVQLDPLLVKLRGAGHQLAIVVDEYGGTSGVVTLEDLVEEIVGEVADEHDKRASVGGRTADGRWNVPGMWRPDEVRERVGASIPDSPAYETIGGFVMCELGRIPVVGDVVDVDGWRIRVVAMDGRRAERVRFIPVRAAGADSLAPLESSARATPTASAHASQEERGQR